MPPTFLYTSRSFIHTSPSTEKGVVYRIRVSQTRLEGPHRPCYLGRHQWVNMSRLVTVQPSAAYISKEERVAKLQSAKKKVCACWQKSHQERIGWLTYSFASTGRPKRPRPRLPLHLCQHQPHRDLSTHLQLSSLYLPISAIFPNREYLQSA